MDQVTRLELEQVLDRASFRAFCAKKKTGPEFAWFVQDELRELDRRDGQRDIGEQG